jgi:Insertion element 4 transposase N-terminal/Transposase DDE domain
VRLEQALAITATVTPEKLETFGKYLDAAWIEEALLATGMATIRRRRLPAEQVVWLVIGMGLMRNLPIVDVVRQLDLALPGAGASRSVAPSSVASARARLGAAPLEWLCLRTGSQWAHESADRDRWRGLALYGVDGSTLRVADSDINRAHFGGQKAGGTRGESGYPMVRIVALMALRSHLLASVNFGPYGVDERTYAQSVWTEVPDDSLTLVDRAYLQANVLVPLMLRGTNRHWMTRAKVNSKWRVLKRLSASDDLVEIEVNRSARAQDPSLPQSYTARAIRYQRRGFQPQILLTSLTDARRYPAAELRILYHERWELELAYDEVKTEMLEREESIRSKSPDAVAQELFGILLAYNLVRLEAQTIADGVGLKPLQISFVNVLRYVVEQWLWASVTATPGGIPARLEDMRDKQRRFALPPRRPKRSYPRAVKIKMTNYPRKRPSPRRGPR